jgi:hypothetical protein
MDCSNIFNYFIYRGFVSAFWFGRRLGFWFYGVFGFIYKSLDFRSKPIHRLAVPFKPMVNVSVIRAIAFSMRFLMRNNHIRIPAMAKANVSAKLLSLFHYCSKVISIFKIVFAHLKLNMSVGFVVVGSLAALADSPTEIIFWKILCDT